MRSVLETMPSHVPLAAFEQHIQADPDVLGMVYTGLLGRGDGDRCSDLDSSRWVRNAAFSQPGPLDHYLGWLGEVHLNSSTQHEHGLSSNAFVGPDWQRGELYIMDSHHPDKYNSGTHTRARGGRTHRRGSSPRPLVLKTRTATGPHPLSLSILLAGVMSVKPAEVGDAVGSIVDSWTSALFFAPDQQPEQ